MTPPRIGITIGDPGGIGPEIILKALYSLTLPPRIQYVLFAPVDLLETQKQSLELARQRVTVSPLLWEAGRINTRDLLESQDALLLAEDSLTAALVDHMIAKLSFFRDIGVLQVKPEGMWKGEVQ